MFSSVTFFRECYASFVFYHGYAFIAFSTSFPVPLIPQLRKEGYEIDAFTESLIGSLSLFVTGICTLFMMTLIGKAGRRTILRIALFMCSVGMIIIVFAPNIVTICCGIALSSGASSITQPIASCYISEICRKERRGLLLSGTYVMGSAATALIFILHPFLAWRMIAVVGAAICFSGFLQTFLVPESKYWYLLNGDEERARKSIRWFRPHINDADLDKNIRDIKQSIAETLSKRSDTPFADFMRQLRRDKSLSTPLYKGIFIHFVRSGAGRGILAVYFVSIITDLQIPYEINSIILGFGIADLIGAILVLSVMHRLHRKTAIYISSSIMIVALSAVIAFKVLQNMGIYVPAFVAVAGLITYSMIIISGYNSLFLIIVSELQVAAFRAEANSIVAGCCVCFFWFYTFIYPYVKLVVPVEYIFAYFVACIIFSVLLVCILLPETSKFEFYENKKVKKQPVVEES